jgi:hypothetical protein
MQRGGKRHPPLVERRKSKAAACICLKIMQITPLHHFLWVL